MNGQPTSHRNRPHPARIVFLLGVVAVALVGVARPAVGQQGAGGFAVRFEGTFRIGGQPAAAGSEIKVITARSATDTFICGTGATRDGGSFQIDVAPAQRCADQGNAGGPVAFIFLYKGERVGGSSKHIDLNRPATLGRTDRVSLSAPEIPDLRDSTQAMVAMRFYGTFRINGQPAPAGAAITVLTARSATDETVCGTGTVTDGGNFYVDIEPLDRCADNGNAGGPVRFIFRSPTGEQVGSASQHLDLNRPATLGHLNRVSLSGRDLPGSSAPPALSSGASVIVTPAPAATAPTSETPAVAASATLVVGRGAGACLVGGTGTCVPELAGGAARFGPLGCAAGATLFWGYLCVTEIPAAAARIQENARRLQVGSSIQVSNTSQSRQPSPRPQASPLPAPGMDPNQTATRQRDRCAYQGVPPIFYGQDRIDHVLEKHTPTGQRLHPPALGRNGQVRSRFNVPDMPTDRENDIRNWPTIVAWSEEAAWNRKGQWERADNDRTACVIQYAIPGVIVGYDETGRETSCIRVDVYDRPGTLGVFKNAFPTRMVPACLAP